KRPKQWLLIKSKDEFAQPGWELEPLLAGPDAEAKPAKTTPKKTPVRKSAGRAKAESKAVSVTEEKRAVKARKSGASVGDRQVRVDNHVVALTHPDKIFWPEEGYSKGDLIRYYSDIAGTILPYLADRPLILKRYPNGIQGKFFFQHDVKDAPDFVRTVPIE